MRLVAELAAQDQFRHAVRDLIGPGLRDLGFRGGQSTGFWYPSGAYFGDVEFRESRYSAPAEVDFGVHLSARHGPTGTRFWAARLDELIPGRLGQPWTVGAGMPAGPVAESVLEGLRAYGWPAIEAALDAPGFPADPLAAWGRTFPARANPWDRLIGDPRAGGLAGALRPAGVRADSWFAELADPDEAARCSAVDRISGEAPDDPRTLPALLDRLEHDPSDRVRWQAARALLPLAGQPAVAAALAAAAALDEDLQVRWAARYALRQACPAA